MHKLKKDEIEYLNARGFQVIQGRTDVRTYPHVKLFDINTGGDIRENCIRYAHTYNSGTCTLGISHPSKNTVEDLINQIEWVVASEKYNEGVAFTTRPGQPIKVFVIDPAWNDVAKKLEEKYKTIEESVAKK